ncbi:MAG: GrpB family protein [Nitriliruptor sp.]|nr:MAG: GrpB family protein [Nitriliruptor sp.]
MEDWPVWATQRVELHQWDATWQQRAAELIATLEPLLGRWLAGPIEHIGSTAVPGLAAKPVIDLQAPVASLVGSKQADRVLNEAGWHLVPPELDQRPWRRLHVLADGDRRIAHLHLVEGDHPRWRETLAFRDRLRERPGLAQEYERLKRTAAQEHSGNREAYTDAKTAFIRSVVADPTTA